MCEFIRLGQNSLLPVPLMPNMTQPEMNINNNKAMSKYEKPDDMFVFILIRTLNK